MTRTFRLIAAIAFVLFFYTSVLNAVPDAHRAFSVKVTGKGQPIILIPGATCSGDEWKETVSRYEKNYQCHTLTLAGYAGTTPLAGGPYLETIKKQIIGYIIDEKLDNVMLVGHSIGGFLSLCIATEMKDHLKKVVVVDAMPFFAGAYNPNATAVYSEEKAKELLSTYEKMDAQAFKANQVNAARFLCRDSSRWDMIATWGATSDKKTFAYTITEMMSNDMRQKISSIKVPVLVLAAYCKMPGYDQYTQANVTSLFENQYKACGACTVHTADGDTKHFIMYDNPDWMYKEMDAFFTK